MSEQHIPEPIELVVLTVPVVFEDSDKYDAYDKVDRHLRNSLDDTDYAEYSEALDTVADCSGLTNQRDELLAALENILSAVPAQDGGGGFIVDHHSLDGEYIGSQNIDPMWVVQEMASISYNAIARVKGQQ